MTERPVTGEPILTDDELAASRPPEDAEPLPGDFEWSALEQAGRAAFVFGTGFVVTMIVLIPLGWWSSASDALRSFLEALPLGSAVADQPWEHGQPLLVAIIFTIVVALVVLGATRWRIRSVHNYIYGGNTLVQPLTVSILRTVVIFGGATLVPVLAVIASGKDLREEPSYTFTGPVWPIIILACWFAYAWVGLAKVHNRELSGGTTHSRWRDWLPI